jgi:hypothetical protein
VPKKDPQGGGGGGGGGGGAAKPSSYEQAIMDALANADKKAKQDKWMTLAQMGLSMMSSQQPNFFAAVGEAGAAAIPAYQKARDTADEQKLKLQGGLYDIAMQRQARNDAMAAASAKQQGSGGFGISASAARGLAPLLEQVNRAAKVLEDIGINPNSDVTDPALGFTTADQQSKAQDAIDRYNTATSMYDTVSGMVSGLGGGVGITEVDPTAEVDVAE